jgi:MFS superfamily sulfate permease-like transporter
MILMQSLPSPFLSESRIGCSNLGFLANLLSRPVLIGYMNGIALLMIIRQLGNLTGTRPSMGDQSLISCGRW